MIYYSVYYDILATDYDIYNNKQKNKTVVTLLQTKNGPAGAGAAASPPSTRLPEGEHWCRQRQPRPSIRSRISQGHTSYCNHWRSSWLPLRGIERVLGSVYNSSLKLSRRRIRRQAAALPERQRSSINWIGWEGGGSTS